jgi:hypothetical protein
MELPINEYELSVIIECLERDGRWELRDRLLGRWELCASLLKLNPECMIAKKENTKYIYESPDKGKTVYKREFGKLEKELI